MPGDLMPDEGQSKSRGDGEPIGVSVAGVSENTNPLPLEVTWFRTPYLAEVGEDGKQAPPLSGLPSRKAARRRRPRTASDLSPASSLLISAAAASSVR